MRGRGTGAGSVRWVVRYRLTSSIFRNEEPTHVPMVDNDITKTEPSKAKHIAEEYFPPPHRRKVPPPGTGTNTPAEKCIIANNDIYYMYNCARDHNKAGRINQ